MIDRPFRLSPVVALSAPGMALIALAIWTLSRLSSGVFTAHDGHGQALVVIASAAVLAMLTLGLGVMAVVYALRRRDGGWRRAGAIMVHVSLALIAVAALLGVLVAVTIVMSNPG